MDHSAVHNGYYHFKTPSNTIHMLTYFVSHLSRKTQLQHYFSNTISTNRENTLTEFTQTLSALHIHTSSILIYYH